MKRVLLVIDVQNEYFSGRLHLTYPPDSFKNILKAMEAAEMNGIDIIVVQHTAPQKDAKTFARGSEGWKLHEKIIKAKYDHLIEKNLPGSFTNTNLEKLLKDEGIDTITICGYMTQMCCDTTARQGSHLEFSIEFLSDATGTLDVSNKGGSVTAEELHRAILVTQAMGFSEVLSTYEWMGKIGKIQK